MAANATAVWRARPSGSNTNGGGFDCSISAAATGTNGSFTGTTFTDATAAAFTAGMVGSSINITGVGQYLITARIDASNITLGSGNPGITMSGGMAWTVGSGQDYSQQNAAQVSQSSTANTSTATTTLTDTGAAFTSALIGNGIRVSGTGITTTLTFITAVPSGTTLTLQTSPGTTGTAVSYNIGGGWADYFTNTTTALNFIVPGNTVYALGSGTPNPASYTYDYTLAASFQPPDGDQTTGMIRFANDPATPGYKAPPDTTGGMPVIKWPSGSSFAFQNANRIRVEGFYFVCSGASANPCFHLGGAWVVRGCVVDQFSYDVTGIGTSANGVAFGCEVFSSVAPGANGSRSAVSYGSIGVIFTCNIHDTVGNGIEITSAGSTIAENIVAKCRGVGILLDANTSNDTNYIKNNTIDGNLGHGIEIGSQQRGQACAIFNNIISNHVQAGKYGLTVDAGTAAANSALAEFIDYNTYYNNTTDLNAINYGPHDTHGGSNPYVAQSTENYTLA